MTPAPDMIELVEPLIPAMRRYARALLRDREAADDLVQDCLERAITRSAIQRSRATRSSATPEPSPVVLTRRGP